MSFLLKPKPTKKISNSSLETYSTSHSKEPAFAQFFKPETLVPQTVNSDEKPLYRNIPL